MLKLLSMLYFRFPDEYQLGLENLVIDNLVYAIHWEKFATDLLAYWKQLSWVVCRYTLVPGP